MNFKNFNFNITLYVLLILATSLLFVWSLDQKYMVATSSGLALLLILETWGLIIYTKKIRRNLLRFIDAVKNQDTSLMFKNSSKDAFMKDLHEGFNEIITDFRLVRKDKQVEHHFFQNTIQHVPVGMIAFNDKGDIMLQNNASKNILDIGTISSISRLNTVHPDLPDLLYSLTHGEESYLKLLIDNEIKNVSIKASEVKLEKENIKIVSFQDISREIDKSELEAWQKLIKVLRHEIMNSISPIRIMSANLLTLTKSGQNKIKEDLADDLINGLQTIRKRSQGLSDFVESYRSISKIPQPNFSTIPIHSLLKEVVSLFDKNSGASEIEINFSITPSELQLLGDENLLQQVLINLLKNAREALQEKKDAVINLTAKEINGRALIQVKDNGKGIPEDQLESIFIPFYTTKENGSGIGLSLSRQVMHLHHGSIHLNSGKGVGTTVTLQF